MTDRELLDHLRADNQDAFDHIFRTHYARLVGLARSILHDPGSAEEIAQDVMLELWRRRASLQLESSLQAYLFRATRNRALNTIRHEKVTRRAEPYLVPERPAAPAAERQLVQKEIDAALQDAVSSLPERCREVFELSRVHGLRYAEIASAMGISVKTVEAQMGKALRILRQRLAQWLPGADDL